MRFAWKSMVHIFICMCILSGLLLTGCNVSDLSAEKSTWDDKPKNTYTEVSDPSNDNNEGAVDNKNPTSNKNDGGGTKNPVSNNNNNDKTEETPILAEGITLNNTSLSIIIGESATLSAAVSPDNATDKTIIWTSSDANVATVTNGKVSAVGAGSAVIIATTANGKTATCTVTVVAPDVDVLPTGIVLSNTSLTITKGTTATISATITPFNATDKTIIWISSDESVATVSGGMVRAVGEGTAAITASTSNGKIATCIVTVETKELDYLLSEDETYYIVTGMGSYTDAQLIIPDTYNNLPVKEIGSAAFYNETNITSLTLGRNIETIGVNAFYSCVKISSLTLPDSLKTIGDSAFYNCYGLKNIILGGEITSIGKNVFGSCTGLTSITVPFVGAAKDGTSNTHFGYIFGASTYSNNKDLLPGSLKTVIITGGSSISSYAFYDCSDIASITISDSVTSIEERAFYYCTGLTSITIPSSVKSIGECAFYKCTGLTSIVIPNSVTSIGSSAFFYCTGLTSITIPDSVTSIDFQSFSGCSGLTSITIPNSVTSIEDWAFYGCTGLTSITIPSSVKSIGDYAFKNCTGLTSIVIPNSVTSIGCYVFSGCAGLASITFDGTVIEWKAISKSSSWNGSSSVTEVVCKDGTVEI